MRKALVLYKRDLQRRGRVPETVEGNLRNARQFLAAVGKPVRRIRRRHVQAYLAALVDLAPLTVSKRLSVIRGLCRVLVEEDLLKVDPTERVRCPKGERSPRVQLTLAQVERLLASSLAGRRRPICLRDRALLELLYGLGLRSSEARAARTSDLNLADGTLLVRRAKGGRSQVLPVPRAALPHLATYLHEGRPHLLKGDDNGRLLVTRRGWALGRTDVNHVVKKVAARAGIAGCHPHALRRAVATHLVEAGVCVRTVQVLLGHEGLETTALYVGVDRAGLRKAVGLLER